MFLPAENLGGKNVFSKKGRMRGKGKMYFQRRGGWGGKGKNVFSKKGRIGLERKNVFSKEGRMGRERKKCFFFKEGEDWAGNDFLTKIYTSEIRLRYW